MGITINLGSLGLDPESVPLDNNSAALQADPNYPANLGDPDLINNPLKGFGDVLQTAAAAEPRSFIQRGETVPYEASAKFKGTLGYSPSKSPYGDMAQIAADNWTMWDAVATGLSGLTDNAISAGKEYAYGWVRAGRALVNFDSSYLKPSAFETEVMGIEQKLISQENPIYFDPTKEDDIFTKQFAAEFLQNSGFTFGTLGGFLTETALLGGAGSLIGKLPKLFKAGALSNSVRLGEMATQGTNTAARTQALTDQIKNMYGTGIFTGKTVFDNALNVASKLPVIGAVADAGKVLRAGAALEGAGAIALSGAEIAKIGAGGLKRAFSEWNFAASEAAIESGGTYGDVYDTLYDKQMAMNEGAPPTPDQLDRIRNSAMRAANKGYNTNFAVLAVMNKIAFGNLFRNFGTDSKFLNILRNDANRVIAVSGQKEGADKITKLFTRGYWGTLGHRSEIIEKFGKKTFYRHMGRDMLRGLGRIELTEGLQENIQEGTNEYLKSYYSDLYDDNVANWGSSFHEAFESQMTKRGFKTFLQGALTGFMVRPVTGAAESIRKSYLERQAKIANPDHVDALDQVLNDLNSFMANPENVLKEHNRMIKEQVLLNEGMTEGAAMGNKYQYLNNKESALIKLALDAKRLGTFDAFKEHLILFNQSLDNQEFKESFGIDLEQEGISSPTEYASKLADKLERYSDLHEKYTKMYDNYLSFDSALTDDYSKQRLFFAQAALKDAIHVAAFNEAKAEGATIRAAEIAQDVATVRAIGQSAAANFNTVTNHTLATQQIAIIDNEIKTLRESGPITPETQRLIDLKEQEKEALTQWNEEAYVQQTIALENREQTQFTPFNRDAMSDEKRARLVDALTKYYDAKNQQSGMGAPVLRSDVDSILESVNDYQKLTRDTRDYIDAVNLLSDPANMIKIARNYEDARVAAYARIVYDTFNSLAEESEIFANYIKENPQDMEKLLKIATSPFASSDNIKAIEIAKIKILELIEKDVVQRTSPQPVGQAGLPSSAANVGAMSPQEATDWISDHYEYNDKDDNPAQPPGLVRFFTNAEGNTQDTHFIPLENILNTFKDSTGEDFTAQDLTPEMIIEYATAFEQELFYQQNPDVQRGAHEEPQKQETIIEEIKRLPNLVGKDVTHLGREGVLKQDEKNYFVEYATGETTILGPVGDTTDSRFEVVPIEGTNRYKLVRVNEPDNNSLDNYPFLQIRVGSLSEDDARVFGEELDAVVTRADGKAYNIVYNNDEQGEVITIAGQKFDITRGDSQEILTMISDYDNIKITFTAQRAQADPNSLDAKYMAIANREYLASQPLTEEQIAAGNDKIEEKGPETIVQESKKTTGITGKKGKKINQDLTDTERAERIISDYPAEYQDAMEMLLFGTTKQRNSVTSELGLKVFNWALATTDKLLKLDTQNPDVNYYITLLSDRILNPLSKKYGVPITTKQPKKTAVRKTEAPKKAARTKAKPGEPSSPGSYEQASGKSVTEFVDKAYEKMLDETAVKIQDLLPTAVSPKLITKKELDQTARSVKFTASKYKSSLNQKDITEDPFDNPPFSCR